MRKVKWTMPFFLDAIYWLKSIRSFVILLLPPIIPLSNNFIIIQPVNSKQSKAGGWVSESRFVQTLSSFLSIVSLSFYSVLIFKRLLISGFGLLHVRELCVWGISIEIYLDSRKVMSFTWNGSLSFSVYLSLLAEWGPPKKRKERMLKLSQPDCRDSGQWVK